MCTVLGNMARPTSTLRVFQGDTTQRKRLNASNACLSQTQGDVRTPVQQSYFAASHNPKTPAVFAMTPSLKAPVQTRAVSSRKPLQEVHQNMAPKQAAARKHLNTAKRIRVESTRKLPKILRAPPKSRITNADRSTPNHSPIPLPVPSSSSIVSEITHPSTPKGQPTRSLCNANLKDLENKHDLVEGSRLSNVEVDALKNAFATSQQMIDNTRRDLLNALKTVNQTEARLVHHTTIVFQKHGISVGNEKLASSDATKKFEEDPPKKRKRADACQIFTAGPHKKSRHCRAQSRVTAASSRRADKSSMNAPLPNLFESL